MTVKVEYIFVSNLLVVGNFVGVLARNPITMDTQATSQNPLEILEKNFKSSMA